MRTRRLRLPFAVAAVAAVVSLAGRQDEATRPRHGMAGLRRLERQRPLFAAREITTANVARLEEAWRFDTGESGGFQVNPIVVHGVVYSPTPSHRVVALDAATGAAQVDVRLEAREPRPQSRRRLLGERRRAAPVRGRRSVSLRPRCHDRRAGAGLRRPGAPRPAARSRARSGGAVDPADHARHRLQGPAHHRRPGRRRRRIVARRHPRPRRPHRRAARGRSTRFRIPAKRATRPGRRTRGG